MRYGADIGVSARKPQLRGQMCADRLGRTLILIALSCAVIFGWSAWVKLAQIKPHGCLTGNVRWDLVRSPNETEARFVVPVKGVAVKDESVGAKEFSSLVHGFKSLQRE